MSKELKHGTTEEKKQFAIPKKAIIIGAAAVAVVAAIITTILLLPKGGENKKENGGLPDEKKIISDLNSRKDITEVTINKKQLSFRVSKVSVDEKTKKLSDDKNTYTFDADVTRENGTYRIMPVKYSIGYKKADNVYSLQAVKAIDEKIILSPLKGISRNDALKTIKKHYKNAKFKSQNTDLNKGTDKLTFTVNDKEYKGSATLIYNFDNTKGWVFKKLDDKVEFKKGVTHKEDGLLTNSGVKNVLFLGIDSDDGSGRSDVMMLVSIDMNKGKIKQTSFMRDNWFNIPGYGSDKLNAAYAYGGADLTVKTIETTFGIKIDNYAAVNFSTFKNIINILGGVDVDITSDEASYINWQLDNNGQAGSIGYVDSSGGVTHLNGQQALWLCRDRGSEYHSGDDFVRTSRQRRVLRSLANTYSNLGPSQVLDLINEVKDNVKTDLSAEDLAWYANRCEKFFSYGFSERCVPQEGEWQAGTSAGGAWIIDLYDFEGLKSSIQHFIYEDL